MTALGNVIDLAAHRPRQSSNIPGPNIHRAELAPARGIGAGERPIARPPRAKQASGDKRAAVKARWRAWVAARMKVAYFDHLRDALQAAECYPQYVPGERLAGTLFQLSDAELFDAYLAAVGAAILTPVVSRGDLDDKRRLARQWGTRTGLTKQRIEKALAADEAYLAIPRAARPAALRRKAVQS